MSFLTARHPRLYQLSLVIMSLLVLVGIFVNQGTAQAATKKAQATHYLEDFRETGRAGTFDFKVAQYPHYRYDGFNTSIGSIDIYDNNVYKGTMKGTVDQYTAGGAQFSGMNITTSGSSSPNVFHNTVKWFPPYPTIARVGCKLSPNPLESAYGDVVQAAACPYAYLNGWDSKMGRRIFLPWGSTDAQAFIHAVINEVNGFNALKSMTVNRLAAVSIPTLPSFISPSYLSNPSFVATTNATRQAVLHPAFAVLGVTLLVLGAIMVIGGTVINQWCTGKANIECMGKHTSSWERAGGIIAVLGGLIVTAAGIELGVAGGIAAAIRGQAAARGAIEGVEIAAGIAATPSLTASEIAAADNLMLEAFAETLV